VFLRMMEGLAAASAMLKTITIDATYLKAHRTASSLRVKKEISAAIFRPSHYSDRAGSNPKTMD
jgi:hypothetical protein